MKNLTSRVRTGLAAGAIAIAAVAAMPSPAQAAGGTYTPHGGPAFALTGNNVSFTAVGADQTFTCEQFDLNGTVTDPGVSRPFGATATAWDQQVSSVCIHWWGGETTFDRTGAWGLAITGPEVGSVSPATLTDAGVFVETAGCSFNIAGEVSGEFDDATGVFTPTGSTLTIADDPAGFICPPLGFIKGDRIAVSGTWNGTGLSITNPWSSER